MTIAEIYARARRLANVNSVQWTDTDMLLDINVIYQDLFETIINRVWEDFFTARFTSDTVIDQTWYDLQEATAITTWHKKIKRVSVKYSSNDTYFQVLNEVNQNSLTKDLAYYAENTPTTEAFYYINANKIHIYPAPTEVIIGAVRIESAVTPVDLITWGAEATVLIPRQFHTVIVMWLLQFIFWHLNKINEKNDAIETYNNLKNDMVTELSDRISSPAIGFLPPLTQYE